MASTSNSNQSQPPVDSSDELTNPVILPWNYRKAIFKNRAKNLPAPIQNRVTALKNIALKRTGIEAEYWKELIQLEEKYHQKMLPLMTKRKEIITGELDPPKEELKCQTQKQKFENSKDLEAFQPILQQFKQLPSDFKGVPNFWAIVFRNCDIPNMQVYDHDVPALQKLLDVQVKNDGKASFTLEFIFDENEYFTDTVLTKKYRVMLPEEATNPFEFDSPIINKCEGYSINWKENKDLTVETIQNENNECEQVPRDSFFNFFDPPVMPENASKTEWVTKGKILQADYKLGHMLRELIIPKAVLFYSGEVVLDMAVKADSDDDEGWTDNYFATYGSPNGGQEPKN